MYEFHYRNILAKYGPERAKLLFTDTDSLCYHIQTDDLYADMAQDLDCYDTSNYPKDHPLYSPINSKVLGKFKDETASIPPTRFVGLKAKMYALETDPSKAPKLTAKGIKRTWAETNLRYDTFENTLFNRQTTYADFYKITSKNHSITTDLLHKQCLDAFDDKRYLLDDGVTSLSYGHREIPAEKRIRPTTDLPPGTFMCAQPPKILVAKEKLQNSQDEFTTEWAANLTN